MIASLAVAQAEAIVRHAQKRAPQVHFDDPTDAWIGLVLAHALRQSRHPEVRAVGDAARHEALRVLSRAGWVG